MILVGVMAAVLWGIGWAMGAPTRARWTMIGILLGAVLVVQLALPESHPLREATGRDARLWLMLAAAGGIVWAYRKWLMSMKKRAAASEPVPAPRTGTFSEAELDRYARHIVLREIGGPGQKRLKEAKVLVVGAGGLGAPALQYLAAAGVGTIGVIDHDTVDNSNLARQVIHRDAEIGNPKVFSAAKAMAAQNPFVTVKPYHRRLTEEVAAELFAEYDMILDGTDNFETRYMVNRVAARVGRPLVAGALTQWEGQISLFDPARDTPCYECIFPEAPDDSLVPSCAQAGVLSPLTGVIGSMMAVEAIKALTGAGETLAGRLLIYDALYADTRIVKLRRRADCAACGGGSE